MMRLVRGLSAILVLLGFVFSVYFYADRIYAKEKDLRNLEVRVDHKIIKDLRDDVQQRIWKYEDRYGDKLEKANQHTKEEFRELIQDKEELDDKLEDIRKKALEDNEQGN